jgi:hypothetical protein
MQMRFKPETYADTHTSISSAGTSSSRLCLVFVNGDRIKIIPFACANNGARARACVHVGVKIVLTMERAARVAVTQDENEEEEKRDEMLINDPDRLVPNLRLLFLFLLLLLLFPYSKIIY